MAGRRELATVAEVHEERSWLFTATDAYGDDEEVILVPCGDGVEAWVNRCTHEAQRFDRGRGVAMRDGQVICPKHGSMFDSCSGYCDNGEAADTTLADSLERVVDREEYDAVVFIGGKDYTDPLTDRFSQIPADVLTPWQTDDYVTGVGRGMAWCNDESRWPENVTAVEEIGEMVG